MNSFLPHRRRGQGSYSSSATHHLLVLWVLVVLGHVTKQCLAQCLLCPDGNTNYNADKLIPFIGGEMETVTCANLEQRGFTISDSVQCQVEIQLNAAWCECPDVEPACSICSDGTVKVPNSDRAEPFQGFQCSGMAYYESLQENCGLTSLFLGIDTPSFCGCPDATPPKLCELCPGGNVERDIPVENFLAGNTCGDVADFFEMITNTTICSSLAGPARALCCGADYKPPKCDICDGKDVVNPDLLVPIPGEGDFACRTLPSLSKNVPATFCNEFRSIVNPVCCEELPGVDGSGGSSIRRNSIFFIHMVPIFLLLSSILVGVC